MKRTVTRAAMTTIVCLLLPAFAPAQKPSRAEAREEANSRSVQGLVVDPADAPAKGAVVQLKDMRTLQVRSYITQEDGAYRFFGLKMDTDYQLTAKFGGLAAGPRNLSIFDTRKQAIINFKLEKQEREKQ